MLGVDIPQILMDQADLVFKAKGIKTTHRHLRTGRCLTHNFGEGFDVVLCLGLMEHIAKPVELFECMAATGAELLVMDTVLGCTLKLLAKFHAWGSPTRTVSWCWCRLVTL